MSKKFHVPTGEIVWLRGNLNGGRVQIQRADGTREIVPGSELRRVSQAATQEDVVLACQLGLPIADVRRERRAAERELHQPMPRPEPEQRSLTLFERLRDLPAPRRCCECRARVTRGTYLASDRRQVVCALCAWERSNQKAGA